jgi:hypothetical protein
MTNEINHAKTIVITSAGYALIEYEYPQPPPQESLNPMGNFYRKSHIHKSTQRMFDELIENAPLPNIGDSFQLETVGEKVVATVVKVTPNYVPSKETIKLLRVDEVIQDAK